ncbi:hypothetical protein BaRGS_00025873, partial [Batillaria attramentaria]
MFRRESAVRTDWSWCLLLLFVVTITLSTRQCKVQAESQCKEKSTAYNKNLFEKATRGCQSEGEFSGMDFTPTSPSILEDTSGTAWHHVQETTQSWELDVPDTDHHGITFDILQNVKTSNLQVYTCGSQDLVMTTRVTLEGGRGVSPVSCIKSETLVHGV